MGRQQAGVLSSIRQLFSGPAPVRTADDLHDFLKSRSAFISQRCTMEYCRFKSHGFWPQLIKEREFLDELEICRWQGYAAVLADIAVVIEGFLRPHAEDRQRFLADWLAQSAEGALEEHRTVVPGSPDLPDTMRELRARLGQVQLAAPKPVHEVAKTAGEAIYRSMPIHPRLRVDDLLVVQNNVRFNTCMVYEELEKRAVLPELAHSVVSAAGADTANEGLPGS